MQKPLNLRRIAILASLTVLPFTATADVETNGNGHSKHRRDSVSCGDVLSERGTYKLKEHLSCVGDIGIHIIGSDITLNMNGYSLNCDRASVADVTFGIRVEDASRVRIRNGTVSDCFIGIFMLRTKHSLVNRMLLTRNDFNDSGDPSGLLLNNSHRNTIRNNEMTENGHGISLFDSKRNLLVGNNSSDNLFDGLRVLPIGPEENPDYDPAVSGSHKNIVRRNDFNNNGNNGIQMSGPARGNIVVRNTANDNLDFIGFLVYGIPSAGLPVPKNNFFRRNTASGNTFVDAADADLDSPDFLPDGCYNDWRNNSFDSSIGVCIE